MKCNVCLEDLSNEQLPKQLQHINNCKILSTAKSSSKVILDEVCGTTVFEATSKRSFYEHYSQHKEEKFICTECPEVWTY